MKIDTHACDICKVQKREVNHWFKAFTFQHVVKGKEGLMGIQILPWEAEFPRVFEDSNVIHLCGIECAMKWSGRELSKLSGNPCVETVESV